jgi:HEAT repeat protein
LARPPVVDPLIAALGDPDPRVRFRAIFWLGKIKNPRAVKALAIALVKGSRDAGDALLSIHAPGTVDVLVEALRDADLPRDVEFEVAAVLAIDRERSLQLLLATLNDPDANVRGNTIRVLGRFYEARAIPQLISALGDRVVSIRRLAAIALVRIGRPEGADALISLAKQNDPRVIADIYPGLIMLGDPLLERPLIESLNSGFGDREMAEAFLNCGNPKLAAAARAWAKDHGYEITSFGGEQTASWGNRF